MYLESIAKYYCILVWFMVHEECTVESNECITISIFCLNKSSVNVTLSPGT